MYKLNRRITLKAWTSSQDIYGGNTAVPVASYELWAQVDDRTGFYSTQEGQMVWPYDYKIVFRDEASRRVGSNFTIDYDNKRFIINGLTHENESHRKFVIARCTAIDATVEESGGGVVVPVDGNIYKYYGIGGETNFVTDLKYKTILSATKDGILYEVIFTGVPIGKQVAYNTNTGSFIWGTPFEIGEYAQILYQ